MIDRVILRSRLFEGRVAVGAGHLLARVAELQLPEPILRPFINAYASWFDVDMSAVLTPPEGFGCFGEFFARRLRQDARPVCRDPGAVVSPCDAAVLGRGEIDADASTMVTIKGTTYSIPDLIGDADVAADLAGGGYCLLYLHPRDYHRVHVPIDGTLREARHMPGARYPMAPWASGFAHGALGKNERVAFDIEIPRDGRRCVLLMVAAFGVGGIESPHLPAPTFEAGTRRASLNAAVARGNDLAAFRIGSTVGLFWPPEVLVLSSGVDVGSRVLAGQEIGRVGGAS